MYTTFDTPATSAELDQFYGTSLTPQEVDYEIGKASTKFDSDELADVVAVAFENIADLIAANDAPAIGAYVMFLRRQRIADIASKQIYGRVGVLSASEVNV